MILTAREFKARQDWIKKNLVHIAVRVVDAMQGGADTSDYFPTVTNSRLWLSRDRNLYTDTAGTTAAAVNDSIARWDAVGGDWGTDSARQATGSLRPLLKSDGIQSDGVDDLLTFVSAITLTGDFTLYTVGKRSASNTLLFVGSASDTTSYLYYSDNKAYQEHTTGFAIYASANPTTEVISRWTHSSAGAGSLRVDGTTHTATGVTGTASFANILARTVAAVYSASTSRLQQIVLVNKLISHGDADDLAIIAKLQELEPTASWS